MLTEYTTPGESVEVRDDESIYSLLTGRIARTGEDTVIAEHKTAPGQWTKVTTGEFHNAVLAAAKGLIAFGINKGDAVTIFSTTRYEWGVLDFALAAIGAVNVPIYDTDSAAQAERILNDSDVKLAIADNRERFDRLDSVIARCPSLKHILMLDSNAMGALEGLGVTVSDEELEARIDSVHADDLATIVYTSGSTGAPKGAELSHRNFISITRAGSLALHEIVLEDHPRLLLFLPLAHCFARFIQYASIASDDGVVGYLPDTKTLLPDLRSFEPTYLLGVPRVFEKVYNAASRKAGTGWKGRLFLKAAEAARDWSRMQQAGERPTAKQIAQHLSYEASVYRTVRSALGPRIRYVACGGAPLDVSLAHFFNGIGLPMIQGYGMTETAAPFAATRVTDNVIGTVGQPAPGSSVRISDDGELQVKGPNVFRGYHNLPEKTAEAFTEDGWLKTGDLASIDDEGRITITGRKKDIIITAGPSDSFLSAVRRNGKFEFLLCNWGADYSDPETETDPFYQAEDSRGMRYAYLRTGVEDGIITGETAEYVMTYMSMVEKAKAITEDLDARYEAFADAEAFLIENALVIPLGMPVPPYIATRLNLWEGQYAPTGLSSNRLKGVHILDHYVSMDEYDQNRDAR